MTTIPIYALVDTWDAAGTTFKGIALNVTDTASAAGSLLIDLQIGGASQFSVTKAGVITNGTLALSKVTGLGTGVATALAINTGSAGGVVTTGSAPTFGRVLANTLTIGLGGQTTVATNTALGFEALNSASLTGGSNVGVGYLAMKLNTTGANNSATGTGALESNTTGNFNSAFGYAALVLNTTGTGNTAVGRDALFNNTTGSNNTAVGDDAGDVITTGARNTIIGRNSDPSANDGNDQTVVGEGLAGKGNDTAFIGGTNGAYNEKNVTTWETTSDARIKKDIEDFAGGIDVLEQIRVRTFAYRTADEITDLPASAAINKSGTQLGVIAQELQAVLPECVTENSTGVLSINTDPLIWYLINAVKQLSAEVQALKGI